MQYLILIITLQNSFELNIVVLARLWRHRLNNIVCVIVISCYPGYTQIYLFMKIQTRSTSHALIRLE